MGLPRQDRNGARTPQSVEQKYGLQKTKKKIDEQETDITKQKEEITAALEDVKAIATMLQRKVDKEAGKGLSTNDFTDEYKNELDILVDLDTDTIQSLLDSIKVDTYDLTDYKTSNVNLAKGSLTIKNKRAILHAELTMATTGISLVLFENLPIGDVSYQYEFKQGTYTLANQSLKVTSTEKLTTLLINLIFDI